MRASRHGRSRRPHARRAAGQPAPVDAAVRWLRVGAALERDQRDAGQHDTLNDFYQHPRCDLDAGYASLPWNSSIDDITDPTPPLEPTLARQPVPRVVAAQPPA